MQPLYDARRLLATTLPLPLGYHHLKHAFWRSALGRAVASR